jgi:organic radical activating enzyme
MSCGIKDDSKEIQKALDQAGKRKYPIAEIFTSPQGEGLYSGTMMTFIRLAGCSVGQKITSEMELRNKFGPLPVYTEMCTTWDGREFACDTDFRTKATMTMDEILSNVPSDVERVCLTGGEPLNFPLTEFIGRCDGAAKIIHIETSGTVSFKKAFPEFTTADLIGDSILGYIWITVSPKKGCTEEMYGLANEVKFLVDEHFDPAKIPDVAKHKELIWIQPINFENKINWENMQRCLDLQKKYPNWRISNQSHKAWGVR